MHVVHTPRRRTQSSHWDSSRFFISQCSDIRLKNPYHYPSVAQCRVQLKFSQNMTVLARVRSLVHPCPRTDVLQRALSSAGAGRAGPDNAEGDDSDLNRQTVPGQEHGTTREHARRTIADEFRDIVLPRPLPNPPEYERSLDANGVADHAEGESAKHGKRGEGAPATDPGSTLTSLREGLMMYADTWRRGNNDDDAKDAASGSSTDTSNNPDSEASKLLEEVQLGSSTIQDVVKNSYAVRARAFQLAVKEFVVGWHETRHHNRT